MHLCIFNEIIILSDDNEDVYENAGLAETSQTRNMKLLLCITIVLGIGSLK